ncbi:MAG: hypothetical protein AAF267_14915 [Deinococcota bacterium]
MSETKEINWRDKLIEEINLAPEDHLPILYNVAHQLRLNLEQQSKLNNELGDVIAPFAGAWRDWDDDDFEDFLDEIYSRRGQKGRRARYEEILE